VSLASAADLREGYQHQDNYHGTGAHSVAGKEDGSEVRLQKLTQKAGNNQHCGTAEDEFDIFHVICIGEKAAF
jgi:hypothetical protein